MAAVESTAPVNGGKKNVIVKPERPDTDAFKKAEAEAKVAHEKAQAELNAIRAKLDSTKPGQGNKNPRQQEIQNELSEIRSKVAAKKNTRNRVEEQIKTLQDSINARVKDLNAKKGNMPFRTPEDLDNAVNKIQRNIDTGKMKIVEEKRALQEISNLNKQRRNFATFATEQKAIDADREKLKEMKDKKQDPELKELNEKYETLDKEFKDMKAERDAVFQNLNQLRDERTRLQAVQQEKWQAIQQIRDDYYSKMKKFNTYNAEAKKIIAERRAKEDAEYKLKKKRAIAAEKMEVASQPAFASQIVTCETLIAYFDPSSAEAAKKAKAAASAVRELAAPVGREVEKKEGKVLKKEEEDYFVGGGGKKKKGKKNRNAATEEAAAEPVSTKFNLNFGVLEQLSEVEVPAPSGREDIPRVLEELNKKLAWYKDNQDRVTKENIAKAQKEIDKLEKEDEQAEAPANGADAASPAPEAEKPAAETAETAETTEVTAES